MNVNKQIEEKKAALASIHPPANQEGMPEYHHTRAAIFSELADLYAQSGMKEAENLARMNQQIELDAARSWSMNNTSMEGGRRKRKSRRIRSGKK
jgi:hypothetical protein